jgi:glutamate synthase (NADPH/NADH) small chain
MGKVTGFLEYQREQQERRPVDERLKDWLELYKPFPEEKKIEQAARCMDCGVPFCHGACPLGNIIPDWNDMAFNGRWHSAIKRLHSTNNFPEFTGRICPALCEASCVLGINEEPVSIKLIEKMIVERAWEEGWIKPEPPENNTGMKVAVVGAGPAGLAAAQQLRRSGHSVTVYDKNPRVGGLMRFGIPNYKLEKWVIDRRIDQLKAEGVTFLTNAHVGVNIPVKELTDHYDAVLLTGGAGQPRNLNIPGRELKGVHFALELLDQQNRRVEGDFIEPAQTVSAEGKRVLVIGGGDTGADCVGTSLRHGAVSVCQVEIMPKPAEGRAPSTPWPLWPLMLRTETSHEEGGDRLERLWSVNSLKFTGDAQGNVKQVHMVTVGPPPKFEAVAGSEKVMDVDLVLIAMGFLGPVKNGMLEELGVELDGRGNVAAKSGHASSVEGVFTAGDMHTGQSLVVRAMSDGRRAAADIDSYLSTRTPKGEKRRHVTA